MRDRFRWTLQRFCWVSVLRAGPAASEPDPRRRRRTGDSQDRARNIWRPWRAATPKRFSGSGRPMATSWTSKAARIRLAKLIAHETQAATPTEPKPEVKVTATSIRFLTADVAIEDGTSEVSPAGLAEGLPPLGGRFSVIWVKQDGKWRLASLREMRAEPPATAAQLDDLDWMTGEWSGTQRRNQDRGFGPLERDAHLSACATSRVIQRQQRGLQRAQRIGWDPLTHKIKSWVFDGKRRPRRGDLDEVGAIPGSCKPAACSATVSNHFDQRLYARLARISFSWKSIGATDRPIEPGPELNIKLTRKPAAP